MTEWWAGLSVMEKIYWYFAVPFTAAFLVQMVLTFIGMGETEGDMDADIDWDGDVDGFDGESSVFEETFKLFTVRGLITFFTVFGWSGITFTHAGLSSTMTLVISVILGFIAMMLIAGMFYLILKLTESGNQNYHNAIGYVGSVYIPIPPQQSGIGKIHITFQGNFQEMDAMTTGEAIATGQMVKVVNIVNHSIAIVKPYYKKGGS